MARRRSRSITQAFLNSAEYTNAHTGISNTQFVDALYVDALGRHGAASELHGMGGRHISRAVTRRCCVGHFRIFEAQAHQLPNIEQGWKLVT